MDIHQTNTSAVQISAISVEDIHEETERVLADPVFRYSQRSVNLLRYIVDRSLKGERESLKERIIGIEVFGRSPDYDTSNDSTVRVVANEVRKRLAEYYSKPENIHRVRIEVPIRSYVADFKLNKEVEAATEPPVVSPAITEEHQTINTIQAESHIAAAPRAIYRRYAIAAAGSLVIAIGIWAAVRMLTPISPLDKFWAPVVRSSGPAVICVGSGYNPLDEAPVASNPAPAATTGQNIPFYDAEQRVFVRMLDANAAEQLTSYLRGKGKESEVRPTEGTQLSDLRSEPLILYGMFLNEWAEKAGGDLRFRLRKDSESGHGVRWIEDAGNPAKKDWSVDLSTPVDKIDTDYALLTRVKDQTTGQWWIGIAGLTGVGTLAANRIALDDAAMSTIAARLSRGWDKQNLQIVLEIKVVQGSPGATRIVSAYSW